MSAVLVQQKGKTQSATASLSDTFASPLTAGNSVIAIHSNDQGGAGTVKVGAESLSLGREQAVGVQIWLYYIHNITGGETGWSIGIDDPGRMTATFLEFSGLLNQAPESVNSNSGTLSSTVTTGSVTPSSAANLIIAGGAWTANDYSTGPTNGFTRDTAVGGGVRYIESAHLIQSSATAQSTGWGLTLGINWAAVIAAFGATGAAPSVNSNFLSIL